MPEHTNALIRLLGLLLMALNWAGGAHMRRWYRPGLEADAVIRGQRILRLHSQQLGYQHHDEAKHHCHQRRVDGFQRAAANADEESVFHGLECVRANQHKQTGWGG